MYIDLLLEEAVWNFDKNVKTERKVTDFPSESGDGYVDYVLMGDNELPFVVEAKSLSKSPESAQQ